MMTISYRAERTRALGTVIGPVGHDDGFPCGFFRCPTVSSSGGGASSILYYMLRLNQLT
jgi:hypothetical protein